jgi:hypothetical protein
MWFYYGVLLTWDNFVDYLGEEDIELSVSFSLGYKRVEDFRASDDYPEFLENRSDFLSDSLFLDENGQPREAELGEIKKLKETDLRIVNIVEDRYIFIGMRYRGAIGRFCRADQLVVPRLEDQQAVDRELAYQGLDQFEITSYYFQAGVGVREPNVGSICPDLEADLKRLS